MQKLTIKQIHFLSDSVSDKKHKYYDSVSTSLNKLKYLGFDFFTYREVFERFVCEKFISIGQTKVIELQSLETMQKKDVNNLILPNLLGINLHSQRRVELLKDFFNHYESNREIFIKKNLYLNTSYFQLDVIPNVPLKVLNPSSWLRKRYFLNIAKTRIQMYENFIKSKGLLVGKSKSINPTRTLHYYDVPWAINYFKYLKFRDGAHRRAILNLLGYNYVPTLIVHFDKINVELLRQNKVDPIIIDFFELFRGIVIKIKNTR